MGEFDSTRRASETAPPEGSPATDTDRPRAPSTGQLRVGGVDDPQEAEADRIADRVIRRIGQLSEGQYPTADRRAEEAGRIRRSPSSAVPPVGRDGGAADAETERIIKTSRGRGAPLDGSTRQMMEAGFGRDLSDVRVHTGPAVDRANERLGSRAFTVGSDVYFRDGAPSTSSADGRHLIAHEIAHTQEGRATARRQTLIRRDVQGRDFKDPVVARYRQDVQSTRTWPTHGHLDSAAKSERIEIKLYEQDLSDPSNPRARLIHTIGEGEARSFGLINTGDAGHWEVLVPAGSSKANTRDREHALVGDPGQTFRIHEIDTVSNGDCGYDGIHIIKYGTSATEEKLTAYRTGALADYSDEDVRAELIEIYEQYAQKRRKPGADRAEVGRTMGVTEVLLLTFERLYAREHPAGQGGRATRANPTSATTSSGRGKKRSGGGAKQQSNAGGKKQPGTSRSGGKASSSKSGIVVDLETDITPGSDLPDFRPPEIDDAQSLFESAGKIKRRADLLGDEYVRSFYGTEFYEAELADYYESRQSAQRAIEAAVNRLDGDRGLALAENAYRAAQAHHLRYGSRSKKTLLSKSTSDKAESEAMDILAGDMDTRITRLMPLLSTKAKRDPDHFKATLRWLGGGDTAELKKRYEIAAGVSLDDALAECFGGRQTLQYLYLKEVVDTGRPGPNARLALRLGLLYPKWTPFAWNIGGAVPGVADKERLRSFMKDDPGSFRPLVTMAVTKEAVTSTHKETKKELKAGKKAAKTAKKSGATVGGGDPEKRFLQEAFMVLDRSGLLGEVAAFHNLSEAKKAAEEGGTDDQVDLTSDHRRYLFSLVYNTRREEVRHLRFRPPFHVQHLRHDLVHWVKDLADPADREKFAEAGQAVLDGNPQTDNPYNTFWTGLRKHNLISHMKAQYVVSVAQSQASSDIDDDSWEQHDRAGRVGELEATLVLEHEKGNKASRRVGRAGMAELARQYLSADGSPDFDPLKAILYRHNEPGIAKIENAQGSAATRKQLRTQFDVAWKKFDKILSGAGISESQRRGLRSFVMLRGSTGTEGTSEFNVVDNYLALLDKPGPNDCLRHVQALGHDTLEWALAHRDRILHRYLFTTLAMYSSGGTRRKWKAACAILQITETPPPPMPGETYDSFGGIHMDRDRILSEDDVADLQQQGGHSQLARHYAGRLYAGTRVDRDGNRLLEIAYEAQREEVSGPAVVNELKKIDTNTATTLAKGASRWHRARGENTAYEKVGEYLRATKGAPIKLSDLVYASRAVTSFGVDTASRDAAIQLISKDNVLEFADERAFLELEDLTKRRLTARLELFEEQQKATPDKSRLDALTERIDSLTEDVELLEIGIDHDLEHRLKKVFRSGDLVAQKRRIFELMGDALGEGSHEKLQEMRLSEAELRFKGIQTKAKSDLVEQRALQSGISWDHRSTASMETAEAEGMLLSTYWTNQKKLHALQSKSSLSENDRATQSALLDELAETEKQLRETQAYFRQVQDRLAKQTVSIITTILSVLIAIAGLASGVGAAAGVIQLMWAIGSSVLTSIVTQVLKAGLSREGEFSGAEAVKESLITLISDVISFSVVQELTLAVDLAMIGVHAGNEATQLFGKPALAALKGQITHWLGDVPEGMINQFFKKKPISNFAPDVADAFWNKLKTFPAQMFVAYVKAFATESFRMGQKEFFAALDADGLVWTPESSMGGIGATQTDAEGNISTTTAYDEAMSDKSIFGSGVLNDQRQFHFGPQSTVGNTSWGGTENLPAVLGTSVKTALYQEVVVSQIQQRIGNLAQRGVDVVYGNQTENLEVDGPDRQREVEQPPTLGRDERAVGLVAGYFDHIGLRLGDVRTKQAAHRAIRAALPGPATTKGKRSSSPTEADRAVAMFDHYLEQVLVLLPYSKQHSKGATYEGQMLGGKREGHGTFNYANGDSYVGSWKAGARHGFGTYCWKSGDVYNGNWENDEFHGDGFYEWESGDTYFGPFDRGRFHGEGRYEFRSGSTYRGTFVADKFEGTGKYTSSTGWWYDGDFVDDEFHGTGEKQLADGRRYVGEFRNGHFDGPGCMYAPDGTPESMGLWRKGVLEIPNGGAQWAMDGTNLGPLPKDVADQEQQELAAQDTGTKRSKRSKRSTGSKRGTKKSARDDGTAPEQKKTDRKSTQRHDEKVLAH